MCGQAYLEEVVANLVREKIKLLGNIKSACILLGHLHTRETADNYYLQEALNRLRKLL